MGRLKEKVILIPFTNKFGQQRIRIMNIVDAVENGDLRALKILVENGADVNKKEGDWSALMLASANRNIEAVKYLLSIGADLEIKYGGGFPHFTALGWAAVYGFTDIAKILVDNGADTNCVEEDGTTLLMHILITEDPNPEVIQLLLENGADASATSKGGITPLQVATSYGHIEIAKMIQNYGGGYKYSNDADEDQTFRGLCELFFNRDYETCVLEGLELIWTKRAKHEMIQLVIISLLRSKGRGPWKTSHFETYASNTLTAQSIVEVVALADDPWMTALLQLTIGKIDFSKVISLASGIVQRCQAYYYYGAWLLTIGKENDAIKKFQTALEQKAACVERNFAERELQIINQSIIDNDSLQTGDFEANLSFASNTMSGKAGIITDSTLSNLLGKLFKNREAVVFCGAGISREPPAGLPDWGKLRDYTLEVIAADDDVLKKHLKNLTGNELIASSDNKGLVPEFVASTICEDCEGYFESFRVLEDGEPNANHKYLAKLGKSRHLKYILTTNFDLFIERAMEEEGLPYRVYRSEQEFADFDLTSKDNIIHILKLHGCISDPETITATVEQEGQRLSNSKEKILQHLLSHYYFIFLGYSGADLKIDHDYLSMKTMKGKAKGFIWTFRQTENFTEEINPHVSELARLYGNKAQIFYSKLPELFDTLFPPSERIARNNYTSAQDIAWKEEKNARLKELLLIWARQYLSKDNSCNIFGTLLEHTGQMEAALECYQRFAQIAKPNIVKPHYANALNNMGEIFRIQKEYDKAKDCYEKAKAINENFGNKKGVATQLNNMGLIYSNQGKHENALACYREAEKIFRVLGHNKGLSASLINIGQRYMDLGKFDKALISFQEAEQLDRSLGDKKAIANDLEKLAGYYYTQEMYETALGYYKKAEELDRIFGNKVNLSVLLINIGDIYKKMGEYDKALASLLEAEQIIRDHKTNENLIHCLLQLFMVYKAKGDFSKAMEYYEESLRLG